MYSKIDPADAPILTLALTSNTIPLTKVEDLADTFGVMYLLGYSLNNLTLMALTISTGFVVDDAIVIIENIARYVELGEKPLQAALKGAEQIGFTIVSLTVSFQKSAFDLQDIYVNSTSGGQVPLSAFTHFENGIAPLSVNHQGQFPVVTISFNLAPAASLGNAIAAIDQAQKDLGMPPSIQAAFQGTAASFRASLSNEPILILAALVTVYIVLGVLYESYIHPITILSTLPSAGGRVVQASAVVDVRSQGDDEDRRIRRVDLSIRGIAGEIRRQVTPGSVDARLYISCRTYGKPVTQTESPPFSLSFFDSRAPISSTRSPVCARRFHS
jgi:Cu/Ag efflux pump CusA